MYTYAKLLEHRAGEPLQFVVHLLLRVGRIWPHDDAVRPRIVKFLDEVQIGRLTIHGYG